MAYTKVTSDDIDNWEKDYIRQNTALQGEQDEAERRRLQSELEEIGGRIEQRLEQVAVVIRKSYTSHANKVDLWVVDAQRQQKEAKNVVAKFKRRPNQTDLVKQLTDKISRLTILEKSILNDNQDYGDSWFDFRGAVVTKVPLKYRQKFANFRTQLMNDSKVIATKRQQIVQIRREVKALQTITEKAALKRDIKQGTGQDRSPDEAYAVVDEINRKLDKMVAELARPRGMTSPPYSIETNADSLEQHANDANWVKVPSNLLLDRSYLKNAETTYKVSATQATTMVNVLAISKRGLRSHELKDPGVIARLATAQKKITDVQKDLKTYLGHLNRAKKAMAKLESKFKAEAKKKK